MNTNETTHAKAVSSTEMLGLCRDCKHWKRTAMTEESLGFYPINQTPDNGWLQQVCARVERAMTITASGGWDGATVDSVETDANFGCVLFQPNALDEPQRK